MSGAAARQHRQFSGFVPLDATFLYVPNQFFDVCLRDCSQSCIRLVGYLLLKTLGWLDGNGNPVEQEISVSWSELTTEAGISRGAIRSAIEEAINAQFICCAQEGRAKADNDAGQKARYALRWDASGEYSNTPAAFRGFYTGEGCRTPIPHAFFREVVKSERLAVIKVVGTVLRHTVGYQNQFGGRRSDAPLSFSVIQTYAQVKNRTTLSEAVRDALQIGYITRVADGVFSPKGAHRRPATYSVNWHQKATKPCISSESVPAMDQFTKRTSNDSESVPADQFRIRTNRKTDKKNTLKQHDEPFVVVVNGKSPVVQALRDAGFDEASAARLAEKRGLAEIQQQIAWLPKRNAERNPLGMLRRAIEENWAEPHTVDAQNAQYSLAERFSACQAKQTGEDAKHAERRRKHALRRRQLLAGWNPLSAQERERLRQDAVANAPSREQRRQFRTCDLTNPPTPMLEVIASHLSAGVGE